MGHLCSASARTGTIAVIAVFDSPDPAVQLIRRLLEERGRGKTICPSEVARALAGPDPDWRAAMPVVHRAVDALVAEGAVVLSWRGQPLHRRDGPYRIGLRG